ncbi:MAG: thioredoxin [Vicinamibacterales bacterium]|nr:thioredoxin [Vicinamibacterales bacterium]
MAGLRTDDKGIVMACGACGAQNRVAYARLGARARCAKCQTDLPAPSTPVDVATAAHFDALVRQSPLPVLVDFWAAWCAPCRMVAPEVAKVASANAGRLLVVKVDTEAVSDLAARLGIQSIPTLAVYAGGREAARTAGVMSADRIEAFIAQAPTARKH